jgi:hypothetical protein
MLARWCLRWAYRPPSHPHVDEPITTPHGVYAELSPPLITSGQPPAGGGHGGTVQLGRRTGSRPCGIWRWTRRWSPDQIPVTVAQPCTAPSRWMRPCRASKSAPATRTAPDHTGRTPRSPMRIAATGSSGSNQSPCSLRTKRPQAVAPSPSRKTSKSGSMPPVCYRPRGPGLGVRDIGGEPRTLLKPSAVKLGRRPVLPYSTEVQQRPLTYTDSCGQEQPKPAGPMTHLPGPPVVRDQEADRVMTEYPDESYDELVRLANLRPPGPGVDKLARNLR